MTSLSNSGVSAVKWSAVLTLSRYALQLVAQIVLARMLGPENYGLFGIGFVVYTFGIFFSDFGFARRLLQQDVVTENDIRFVFTWQLLMGGMASLVIYVGAAWLSGFFNDPRVLPVIQWLSLGCVLNALTSPANNLLQRDLKFKLTGFVQLLSYAIGYLVVGIPLAFMHMGVYTLVAAWLSQSISLCIASYCLRPYSVKPLIWFPGAADSFNYGGKVFITNIVNYLITNIDRIVIGRVLNASAVGLYTVGYNLATLPNSLLLSSLQTVFLAGGAKLKDDKYRLGVAYLQILAAIIVMVLPVFAFLSVMAPQIIALLYGIRWSGTAQVLAILFLGMPAFIAWGLSTPVLWNTGHEQQESLLQLPVIGMGGALLLGFASKGVEVVAIIVAGMLLLRAGITIFAAFRALNLRAGLLIPLIARGGLFGLTTVGLACAPKYFLSATIHPIFALVVSSLFVAVPALLVVLAMPQLLGREACTMLHRFMPRLKLLKEFVRNPVQCI